MASERPPRPFAAKVPDWATSLPVPKSNPPDVSPETVVELLRTKEVGKDFLIVDVRGTDFTAPRVRTAMNVPAMSFCGSLPAFVALAQKVPVVIFYCGNCTPAGRGPRTAAWYQDALDEKGIKTSEAKVLAGGMKGWAAQFADASGDALMSDL